MTPLFQIFLLLAATRSGARLFSVVCVVDSLLEAAVEPRVIQNDFSGMHRFDGVKRNDKFASIFSIDDKFGLPTRRDLTNRAELFTAVINKSLISDFNLLVHDAFIREALRWECDPLVRRAKSQPVPLAAHAWVLPCPSRWRRANNAPKP